MPITIPTDDAGLEEVLSRPATLAEVTETPATLARFIAAYAAKATASDPGITEQVRTLVADGLKDFYRANGAPGRVPMDNGLEPTGYSPGAPGARVDAALAEAGISTQQFWAALAPKPRGEAAAHRAKIDTIMASFGSLAPGDGGFLIPETLRSQIMQVALEQGVVRSRATIVPMDSLRVPFPMIDETTHSGSVRGGVVGYWAEEAAPIVESQATFGRALLEARKLTGYAEIPRELMQDAVGAFSAWVNRAFPEALAFFEDIAFISGTGADRPLGYLDPGNTAAVAVAKETGQTSGTIVWQNIVKMYSRMLPSSLGSAVWIAGLDTFPQLATMSLSVGTGGSAVWLGGPGQMGSQSAPLTILGRPVIFTEKHPALGSAGDIVFADLSYYLVGDRQTLQADASEHYRFQNDKIALRFTQRLDGRPWIKSAITPANGSTATLSPFVTLAAR